MGVFGSNLKGKNKRTQLSLVYHDLLNDIRQSQKSYVTLCHHVITK